MDFWTPHGKIAAMRKNEIRNGEGIVDHVSETSLWVAYYRSKETSRPDALFRDPLAQLLIGQRGPQIAAASAEMSRFTEWSVIARTVIIDAFILKAIQKEQVDLVLNLGAGLDTRPYRMNLPEGLRWVEIDFPQIIELKNDTLRLEKPKCHLERFEFDLSRTDRGVFLQDKIKHAQKVLVLTEGVIPYLSEIQVRALAKDLRDLPNVHSWIAEYLSPVVYKYLLKPARKKMMQKAPFLFFPTDWWGFFKENGWACEEVRYNNDVALESGRKVPRPWFSSIVLFFMNEARKKSLRESAGYAVFKKMK